MPVTIIKVRLIAILWLYWLCYSFKLSLYNMLLSFSFNHQKGSGWWLCDAVLTHSWKTWAFIQFIPTPNYMKTIFLTMCVFYYRCRRSLVQGINPPRHLKSMAGKLQTIRRNNRRYNSMVFDEIITLPGKTLAFWGNYDLETFIIFERGMQRYERITISHLQLNWFRQRDSTCMIHLPCHQ